MFGSLFNKDSLIDKNQLEQLIEEIVTPRLKGWGLTNRRGYQWYNKSVDSVRQGIRYDILKGKRGTFTWGACFDFIPMPVSNGFKYFRTENNFQLQLFEWTDEYSNSFFGGPLEKGTTLHWEYNNARKTISRLLDVYEKRILSWLGNASSLEGLIDIATYQTKSGKFYDLHSPPPQYILAFLLAKNRQFDKAIEYFDSLDKHFFQGKEEIQSKLKTKLFEISKTPTNKF